MVKKIETENDIEMKPDGDIEIEFLGDSPKRSQSKKKAGQKAP